jgi:hypothetical protein
MYQWGRDLGDAVREAFPGNPEYANSLLEKFTAGGGSLAFFMAGGIAGRVVKVPALVSAGGLGATSGGASQFQQALAAGATIDEAMDAAQYGMAIGLTEAIPISRALGRLRRAKGGWRNTAIDTVSGAFEEGSQEALQTVLDDLVASEIIAYDKDAGTWRGVGENAGIGGTLGAMASFITSMIGGRRAGRRARADEDLAAQRKALEDFDKEVLPGDPLAPPAEVVSAPEDELGPVVPPGGEEAAGAMQAIPQRLLMLAREQPHISSLELSPEEIATLRAARIDVDQYGNFQSLQLEQEADRRIKAGEWDNKASIYDTPAEPPAGVKPEDMTQEERNEFYRRAMEEADRREREAEAEPEAEPEAERGAAPMDDLLRASYIEQIRKQGTDPTGMSDSELRAAYQNFFLQKWRKEKGEPDRQRKVQPVSDYVQRARDIWEEQGIGSSHRADSDEAAIKTNVGASAAAEFRNEWERLKNEAVAQRKAARGKPEPVAEDEELDPTDELHSRAGDILTDLSATMSEEDAKSASDQLETIREAAPDHAAFEKAIKAEMPWLWKMLESQREFEEDFVPGQPPPGTGEAPPLTVEDVGVDVTTRKRSQPRPKAPGTMLQAIRRYGGITDEGGDLAAIIGGRPGEGKRERGKFPGLSGIINDKGIASDQMAIQLWEDGYFDEIPSVNELLEAIDEEVRGTPRRSTQTDQEQQEYDDANALEDRAAELDIENINLYTLDELATEVQRREAQLPREVDERLPEEPGATEKTDQGEQYVTPGTEADTRTDAEKELEERRREERLTGRGEQEEPGGMFDEDARAQDDIFDLTDTDLRPSMAGSGTMFEDEAAPLPAKTPGPKHLPHIHDAGLNTATDEFPGKGLTFMERLFWPAKWRTRQSILVPLLAAEGVPLYQGRIKKKSWLGLYRPGRQEVRVRRKGDLEVAAHELAHLLDDKHPEIAEALWRPATNANKATREELKDVSYDRDNVREGWAEFVRAWATRPELAKKHAPKTYEWFEKWLDGYEHGRAWRIAQMRMTDWYRQDPLLRFGSKIGPVESLMRTHAWPASARAHALDDLYGVALMEKDVYGEILQSGGYVTGRLARGAQAVVGGAIRWGAPQWRKEQIVFLDKDGNSDTVIVTRNGKQHLDNNPDYTPWGLENILAPVAKNLQKFGQYAIARRAAHLMKQGREKMLSRAEIDAGIALGEKYAEFEGVFADWNTFNKQLLDFAEQSGLIDKASRKKWETTVYLPFWRADKHNPNARGGRRRGEGQVIFRLKGGTGNLRDPIENMVENTRMLIENSINNNAKRAILAQTQRVGGAAFAVTIPLDNAKVVAYTFSVKEAIFEGMEMGATKEKLAETFEERGLDEDVAGPILEGVMDSLPPFLQVLQYGVRPKGHDIDSVMIAGKPQFFQVGDTLLLRALAQLPRQVNQNKILRILRRVRRLSQLTVTFTADFILRNLIRDQLMAFALTKSGYKPYVTAAKGLRHRLKSDAYYRQYVANGGALASFYSDEAHFRSKLRSMYGTRYQRLLNSPARLMDFLESLGEAAEVSTRIGAFEKAIQAGKDPRRAAFESREISTDFAMRGDNSFLGFFYDTVMFLKAGAVGVDRLYRGVTTDKERGRAWAVTMGIGGAGLGLYILNRLNPLYDDLEDWDKNMHWHFYVPTPEYYAFVREHGRDPETVDEAQGLYHHWRKPKPFEIGGFATLMETAFEAIIGDQPKEQADRSWKALKDMFRFDWMPAAIRPAWDVFVTNNVSFFDVPVESDYQKRLSKWARYSNRNSLAFRELGKSVLRHGPQIVSPAQLEQLVRGYLNTWALYGIMLVDGVFYDQAPDIPFHELPGIRPFYRGKRTARTRQSEVFFDMLREAQKTNAVWQKMRRENEDEIVASLQETRDRAREARLGGANERARKTRQRREAVINARGLSALRKLARRVRTRDKAAYHKMLNNADVWGDAGALRARMIEFWSEEYSAIFRAAVAKEEERQAEEGDSR